ncbi:MAG TPA: hypothetical protein VMC09_09650 [Anaerolineales bacterium]|nr:hypothetical protein [Anaerolineales bacterium]
MNPPSDRPTAPAGTPDLELLRKFEPVVYYTKGEQFFPTEVEGYVRESSLWEHHPDGRDELLVKQGELTLEKLIETRPAEFGSIRYLRFVENLNLAEAAQVLADQTLLRIRLGNYFHAGIGRLARGGFLPRLVDGLFSLSFLLRGKVSAADAAAAEIDYNEIFELNPKYTYYGRVTRQNGWVMLQYWFFFCFNSWRSGFHGVNDHESDWEMVTVYLYEDNGQLIPEWAAYASHDFHGDDLRRRWDDRSQLDLEDGHPVVYAGAGSHASYFRRGEYQAAVNLPLPGWFSGLVRSWNKLWTDMLGQPPVNTLRIPFVDFARGDGLRLGPGGPQAWSPVMIDESTPWASQYRGLWGYFAKDPISGENAPAGPMYNRDGTPRSSWYDLLGFAGLDKVPTPPHAMDMLRENCSKVSHRQEELGKLIPQKAGELQALGIKSKGMEGNPHLAKQYAALEKEIASLSTEVRGLRREQSENAALLQGLTQRLERMQAGLQDDPHAHIRNLAVPDSTAQALRFDRAAETWAAVSLSLLLFAVAALILFVPKYIWAGLLVIFILFVVTESVLRGAFVQTVGRITLLLAMAATIILFLHFWKWIIVVALVAMGISLMYQRLRELTG